MKIINAIHAQSIGGVDQVFRNYAEVLVSKGHEVALLISDNGYDKYEISGIKKIFKLRGLGQVFDFLHLLQIILFFRPDVIICHSNRLMKWSKFLKFFNKIGAIKTKSIAVNHGISFQKSLCCDYVVSINQQISDLVVLAGFDKLKSFVLTNVIKVDREYSSKNLKNPPVIGIYGRLEPRKGFDILIKACELLQNKGQDFKLKIGGFEVPGGYDWGVIKDFSRTHNIFDKCDFVGVVLDKKEFFKDVDIFCMASREEPFGLVALESFLNSTLVISSDTDGGKLLIKNGENGILFANENFTDLSEKIIGVLESPASYGVLTKNAFLRLEKEFSFNFLAREMSQILQKL